jgi:hypothetical protein
MAYFIYLFAYQVYYFGNAVILSPFAKILRSQSGQFLKLFQLYDSNKL